MKITTKTDYAVIILTTLARRPKQVTALELIAAKTHVSEAYLQRIAAMLKKRRLIRAKLGAYGGYTLQRPPEKISLNEVVLAVGDTFHSVRCTDPKGKDCEKSKDCQQQRGWHHLQHKISRLFAETTIAEMIKEQDDQ